MPVTWERVARRSTEFGESDYKQAMYQLVTEQVLYRHDRNQVTSYHAVRSAIAEMKDAVALLGMELYVNTEFEYVVAKPVDTRKRPLSLEHTLLILVLRKMYHESLTHGGIDQYGQAIITIEELMAHYRDVTGRDLPSQTGELKDLFERMKRFGIARPIPAAEGSVQPFDVAILPAVTYLVDETMINRLGANTQAEAGENGDLEDDTREESSAGEESV